MAPGWIVDDLPSTRFPIYCRGNVGEVFPNVVTPLTVSLLGTSAATGQKQAFCELGAAVDGDFDEPDAAVLTGFFKGYLYGNLSLARLMGVRTPGMKPSDIDVQIFGASDAPPYRRQPGDRSLAATVRLGRFLVRTIRGADLSWLDRERTEVEAWLRSLPDFSTATDAELIAIADELPRWFTMHMRSLVLASAYAGGLGAVVERFAGRRARSDPGITMRLTSGIGGVETTVPSVRLWALGRLVAGDAALTTHFDAGIDTLHSRLRAVQGTPSVDAFLEAFDSFLRDFGSRGPDEYELASDTWGTAPDIALAAVERLRLAAASADPVAAAERLARARDAAIADVRASLPPGIRGLFTRAVRSGAEAGVGRERAKATLVHALYGIRLALFELARRAQARGGPAERRDCWLVTREELPAFVASPASFSELIIERKRQLEDLQARVPPFVFDGAIPDPSTWDRRNTIDHGVALAVGEQLTGLGVSPGVRQGRVRVIFDPADPQGLETGDVMVAPITDPAWTPLFLAAEAIVVDVGAQQSHAAIVARELGIPAVVSATDATKRLQDGDVVEVDGDRGIVRVISR